MDIHRAIVARAEAGTAFALVTVLHTEGSTPVKAGAKALVDSHGAIVGTVGGGAVEAEAQRRALEAIQTGRPQVFDFDLEGLAVGEQRPICGGRMRVLVDSTAHMHSSVYASAAAALERRERGVLITALQSPEGPSGALTSAPRVEFFVEAACASVTAFPGGDNLRSALKHEAAERFVTELSGQPQQGEVFVDPVIPRPMLLIVGGGHVGQAVSRQARQVGFDLTVIDDRPEFTRSALFPAGTVARCGDIVRELSAIPFGVDTFIVIATRGHQHDAVALTACLRQPVAYLGMIGSRHKVALMRQEFIASGRATAAELDRVHAPIGLDLGAVTVEEIAVSIVAQLIAVRRLGAAPRFPSKGHS